MLITDIDKTNETRAARYRLKSRLVLFVIVMTLLAAGLAVYHSFKMVPEGVSYAGTRFVVNETDVEFLFDLTYNGNQSEQKIFDTIFKYIAEAQQYILIDMFLFNDWQRRPTELKRHLASELANQLLKKKLANPDIKIDFITDPINTAYGGAKSHLLTQMFDAGINVVVTDLSALPDSNPLYSGWWRLLPAWLGNSQQLGWLPHPFDKTGPKVTLRSYLALLNFKANHRKVFIADNNGQLVSVIGSANAHDASLLNSNVAVSVRGRLAEDIYRAEASVAKFSKASLYSLPTNLINRASAEENNFAYVTLLTENQIKQSALQQINNLTSEDEINLAMFYLSDRDIIAALVAAAKRGVGVKIILDANRQAFGYQKIGVPNLASAKKLLTDSKGRIQIRWYLTQAEQFHTKLLVTKRRATKQYAVLLGSANYTRRNLNNYNLEANCLVELSDQGQQAKTIEAYFNKLWTNEGSVPYTADYQSLAVAPWWLSGLTWLQESSGLSSF